MPRLLEWADRILLVVQPRIRALIEGLSPIRAAGNRILVIADGEGTLTADAWVPLLSVPHRLGIRPETVAAEPTIVRTRSG